MLGPIYISGIAEARVVRFCTQLGYIKFYQMDETSPLKEAWLWSCDPFKFLVLLTYPWKG